MCGQVTTQFRLSLITDCTTEYVSQLSMPLKSVHNKNESFHDQKLDSAGMLEPTKNL